MAVNPKRTKILCTLGPSSDAKGMLRKMINSGMDLARINMSHGEYADHSARIRRLRPAARDADRPIGTLFDLQGPKLRLGTLPPPGLMLKKGQIVQLGGRQTGGDTVWLPVSFRAFAKEVQPGDSILLADGALELKAVKTAGNAVFARVASGGHITSRKGINLPGRVLSIPAFTAKDKADLAFALEHNADFVAMSFVRSATDVRAVKNAMRRAGTLRPVVAKIEKPQALDDIDNIIDVSDGIMVARGDLGVELSVEKVPAAQKTIIRKCAAAGVWVIVATQMLESMIEHPTPTRAEASDVANAVYDGADCVMLSAETAVGKYPDRAVAVMSSICAAAETTERMDSIQRLGMRATRAGGEPRSVRRHVTSAVVEAALVLLDESDAAALWVFTESGRTARYVSKLRPAKPAYAFSPHESTLRYLSGLWGIRPLQIPRVRTTDDMVKAGEKTARRHRYARPGDRVIVLAGQAPTVGTTDLIKIHEVRQRN